MSHDRVRPPSPSHIDTTHAHRVGPSAKVAVLLAAAMLCTGCVEELAEQSEMQVAQAPVIFDELDWRDLWEWGSPETSGGKDKRVAAQYGKAVMGFTAEFHGTCTGFLVNDRQVMTNKHCADDNATFSVLTFGRWAQDTENADQLADAYAKHRLIQMGYDSTRVLALPGPVPASTMPPRGPLASPQASFRCESGVASLPSFSDASFGKRQFQTSRFGKRDVSMWTCTPKVLPILEGGGAATVDPGLIWGHVRLNYDRPPPGAPDVLADGLIGQFVVKDGTDTDVVGHNRSRSNGNLRNLLSPVGQVLDARDACDSDAKQHCFEHDNDTFSGHSGSPVFADSNHVVFGVNHGNSSTHPPECLEDIDETFHNRTITQNVGTYIPHVDDLLPFPYAPVLFPETPTPSTTLPWIGGFGGTVFESDCPTGFRAIGVIGASDTLDEDEENRRLGMFGLVCAPLSVTDMTVGPSEQPPALRPADAMVVLAGGSRDTPHEPGVFSLNRILNESMLTGELHAIVAPDLYAAQLRLHLCPPGQFMRSVLAYASNVVHGIYSIGCGSPDSSFARTRPLEYVSLGNRAGGTKQSSRCNGEEIVSGITIRSGFVTDGFNLRCRNGVTP